MQTYKFLLYLGIIFIIASACTSETSSLEIALLQAGKNRHELQKVLDYYKNDEEKYKAAIFLIENMPYYGSYEGNELNKYYKYYLLSSNAPNNIHSIIDSLTKADGDFRITRLKYKQDIKYIKSSFLINHIDWAFKVRREQPWGKNVKFQDFLEYILPYRIGDEPLSIWREALFNRYNPILDSIRKRPEAEDPLIVARVLYDSLSNINVKYTSEIITGPHLGPAVVNMRVGTCREFTDMMIYAFRAVGIPCGIDQMPLRGDNNTGHLWNFILDKNGNTYMAEFPYQDTLCKASEYSASKAKVKRVTYSLNKEIMEKQKHIKNIHPYFSNYFYKDVTNIYIGNMKSHIDIPKEKIKMKINRKEPIYLCLPKYKEWIPMDYSFISHDSICFDNIEKGSIAILATWDGKKLQTCSSPFMTDQNTSEIHYYAEEEEKLQTAIFYKKCHLYSLEYMDRRIINGVIEGSNRDDFLYKDTLLLITTIADRLYTKVLLTPTKPYRYIRYRGPENSYSDIAELAFFQNINDSIPLKGRIIGTPGCYGDDGSHEYTNVFDGDPYTSFQYKEKGKGWAGIDFGQPTMVHKVVYTPRNFRNFIEKGDDYELFYWHKGEWMSAGHQIAMADSLIYTIPQNTLLYLKNHSRGKDERVFEYRNGKQKFW